MFLYIKYNLDISIHFGPKIYTLQVLIRIYNKTSFYHFEYSC